MTAKRVGSAHKSEPLETAVRKKDGKLIERAQVLMDYENARESDPDCRWTLDEVLSVALRMGLKSMEAMKEAASVKSA